MSRLKRAIYRATRGDPREELAEIRANMHKWFVVWLAIGMTVVAFSIPVGATWTPVDAVLLVALSFGVMTFAFGIHVATIRFLGGPIERWGRRFAS